MATEEVSKHPNLPPYSEMIIAAISALGEKAGSSKAAIAKYMESTYGDLPPSHTSLLSAHLSRMKESGELITVKNNYLRPASGPPPKRGRGRPPKPKPVLPPGYVPSPPRPRGRPPKSVLSPGNVPTPPARPRGRPPGSGLRRPRGRPPLKDRAVAAAAGPSPSPGGSVKRGRGRPPKIRRPLEV